MGGPAPSGAAGTHLVVVPHTHWDREWYRPFESFRRQLVALCDELLDILDADPAFTAFHWDGQTIVLDDYCAIRPRAARRLRAHLASGRLRIGPWRVLPDEFLVTGESLIRNLQQGCADCVRWGVQPNSVGYTPDQFGHVGVLPQILAGVGMTAGVVWRGVGPDVQRTQFIWESPDGTRLFTIYLPGGYSNGFSLPDRVEPLLDRLDEIRGEQEAFCTIPSLLIMNGSDHRRPQRRMPALMAEAVARRPGWSFEIAPLATFVEQAREAASDLDVHTGEFRYPWRANLLPGVTSVRTYQKQMDFRVCRMLERYVEPLCAWANRLGDPSGAWDFIEYAWRLAIENHPHDSICGCSVDAVHDEMDTRWAKVVQVGETLQREALNYLAARCATTRLGRGADQAVVTYTAARPAVQLLDVDVYLDDPRGVQSVQDTTGVRHPVQVTPQSAEVYFQARLPADSLRTMVAGLEGREVQGYVMNNLLIDRQDGELTLTLICAHAEYGDVDIDARRQEVMQALEAHGAGDVQVVGRSATKTRVQALLPVGGQTSLDAFALSPRPPSTEPPAMRVSERGIETDDFRLEAHENGAFGLLDKRTGRLWPRVLRVVDDGDRGDTYNFDPVPGDEPVNAPADVPQFRVAADGPVAATLVVESVYRIPARLRDDRQARATDYTAMPVRIEATCYAGLPRIDFRVTVHNGAEDHRVRAVVDLPFAPRESVAEGPFGVVRRDVALPDTTERFEHFYGTAPMKSFVCVEDAAGGIALFNRGIPEYEATADGDAGTLALTLLRCVGWLSREDLAMRPDGLAGPRVETPGAQSPGTHTFEFALMPYAGTYADAHVAAQAHAYAYPPVAARTGRHRGRIAPGTALVHASHPAVVVSAAALAMDRKDLVVRVYNEAETPVDATATFDGRVKGIEAVDLRERPQPRAEETVTGAQVQARFTPSQIRTWRVRRARTRA